MEDIYEKYISRSQGYFITTKDKVKFESILIKENLPIKGLENIQPSQFTTFHDWFIKPTEYSGLLPNEDKMSKAKIALFYLGEEDNTYYYSQIYIFTPERIGTSYKLGTFRDSNLREINNKLFWK